MSARLKKRIRLLNRRRLIPVQLLHFASFCFFVNILCPSCASLREGPMVWNIENMNAMAKEGPYAAQKALLLEEADVFCKAAPVSIMDKKKTFAPDYHFFCSIGPYWWPDPQRPGQYYNRDGIRNPEAKDYDNGIIGQLVKRCKALSCAYYITKDKKYYDVFIKQLKAWFIDERTLMYPNFEYSQVVPGRNSNRGRSTGLISAYGFNDVIESIRLVNSVRRIDRNTMISLQKWFLSFANWAETEHGEAMKKGKQNISLANDVLMVNMYLFGGNEQRAKEIVDSFFANRILVQIREDGSQPGELARTNAFSYSLTNLAHILDFCFLARYWYPNYFLEKQERIDAGFFFLEQYMNNTESFPYQQISGWEQSIKDFYEQIDRVNILRISN